MLIGFARIKSHTTTHQGAGKAVDFEGRQLSCSEISLQGDVKVHRDELGVALFAACDIEQCHQFDAVDGYLCPPNMPQIQRTAWFLKATKFSKGYKAGFNRIFVDKCFEKQQIVNDFFEQFQEVNSLV